VSKQVVTEGNEMCGIAGFFSSNQRLRNDAMNGILSQMTSVIKHRGPDGEGFWTDDLAGIALGHRRLSIIDLSSHGAQPMHSRCGNLAMIYNGEVYNAPELAIDLKKNGATFQGTSDTEVILEAFSQWGVEATLQKLIGMFAIALWNKSTSDLFLIRDRLGIKPLYWSLNDGDFIFASELKALRQHPACPTELNDTAMDDYLRKGFISGTQSIYKDVFKLLPGTVLRYKQGNSPSTHHFWSLQEVVSRATHAPFTGNFDEAKEELDILLRDAVKIRMISDVSLGTFLSGGIDSSLVTAIMQSESPRPVQTFSIGFNESRFDEAPHAASIAKFLGTEHTEMYVTPEDAFNVIPDIPTIFDEPFSDPSQIPTYLLSKLTREHVTVALSGDGGDELFAGYDRYFIGNKFAKILNQPKSVRQLQAKILSSISPRLGNQISTILPSRLGAHFAGHKLQRIPAALQDGKFTTLYQSILSHHQRPSEALLNNVEAPTPQYGDFSELGIDDRISMMQFIDTLDYMPNDILTKVDRASMAASLEARVPLIDHRIVEFSWSIAPEFKTDGISGKRILRELLYQYVPKELIDRPKKGFTVPIGDWLRGPLKQWAEDLLTTDSLKKTDVFDITHVRNCWKQHQKAQVNWEYHLWDILNLQAWLLNSK